MTTHQGRFLCGDTAHGKHTTMPCVRGDAGAPKQTENSVDVTSKTVEEWMNKLEEPDLRLASQRYFKSLITYMEIVSDGSSSGYQKTVAKVKHAHYQIGLQTIARTWLDRDQLNELDAVLEKDGLTISSITNDNIDIKMVDEDTTERWIKKKHRKPKTR